MIDNFRERFTNKVSFLLNQVCFEYESKSEKHMATQPSNAKLASDWLRGVLYLDKSGSLMLIGSSRKLICISDSEQGGDRRCNGRSKNCPKFRIVDHE